MIINEFRYIKMLLKSQKKRIIIINNSYIISIYCSVPQLGQKIASNDNLVPQYAQKCGFLPYSSAST